MLTQGKGGIGIPNLGCGGRLAAKNMSIFVSESSWSADELASNAIPKILTDTSSYNY